MGSSSLNIGMYKFLPPNFPKANIKEKSSAGILTPTLESMGSSSLNIDMSKFLPPNYSKANIKEKSSPILMKMLLEGLHTDITLKAQGGSIQAHRSVLASCSPVFDAMFKHEMKEHLNSTVDLSSSMHIESLQLFLVLLYSSDHNNQDGKPEFNAIVDKHFDEFVGACYTYQVSHRLVKIINNGLCRNLTLKNCWYYYHRNDLFQNNLEHNVTPLSVCKNYILNNFEKVIHSESIILEMKCNPELVRYFMKLCSRKFAHYRRLVSAP